MLGRKEGSFYSMFKRKDKDYLPHKKAAEMTSDSLEKIEAPETPKMLDDGENIAEKMGAVFVEKPQVADFAAEDLGTTEETAKQPEIEDDNNEALLVTSSDTDQKQNQDTDQEQNEDHLPPSEQARQNIRKLIKNLSPQDEHPATTWRASEKTASALTDAEQNNSNLELAGKIAWDLGPQLAFLVEQNGQIGAKIDLLAKGKLTDAEAQALKEEAAHLLHAGREVQHNLELLYKNIEV